MISSKAINIQCVHTMCDRVQNKQNCQCVQQGLGSGVQKERERERERALLGYCQGRDRQTAEMDQGGIRLIRVQSLRTHSIVREHIFLLDTGIRLIRVQSLDQTHQSLEFRGSRCSLAKQKRTHSILKEHILQ